MRYSESLRSGVKEQEESGFGFCFLLPPNTKRGELYFAAASEGETMK